MKTEVGTYWILTSEYPPFYGGGISTYCLHTARMLQENGHKVTVFVYDNNVRNTKTDFDNGIRIIRFSPNRTGTGSFLGYNAQLSYEYAAIVKEFLEAEAAPDVIESQEYLGIAYYLLQFRWLGYDWCKNLKILITAHSPAFLYLPQNHISMYKYPLFWLGEMERFCLKAADMVISPTQFLLNQIQEDTELDEVPVEVVRNPYQSETANIDSMVNGTDLVLVAKLSVQKGSFKLLEYMKGLWQNRPEIKLTLVGDDSIVYHPEKRTMGDIVRERYAREIENGQLLLLDKQHPSAYAEVLRKASVALVPSVFDNLPYVALEMMAHGKLLLVSKQGGQAEIITHGVNGFLFDHKVPGDFERQLEQLLSLSADSKKEIVESAKATLLSEYSYAAIYKAKRNLLRNIQNRSGYSQLFPFLRPTNKELRETGSGGNDLLSIVVTYYNSGKYLKELISNLDEVDYSPREIVIIDDGSDELESLRALRQLDGKDGFRVIRQKNLGLGASRNRGAMEARGSYLAFIDADDLVLPDYYTKAIAVMSRYSNVHCVGAWTKYFEGSNKVWPTFQSEPPVLLYHNCINSAAVVFRRSSFLRVGGNDTQMIFPGFEDYETMIRFVSNKMYSVALPEVLFRYRVRHNSMVRSINSYKRKLIREYIRSKHVQLFETYGVQLLNLEAMNGPAHLLDNPSLDYDFADKIPVGGRWAMRLAGLVKRNRFLRPVAYRVYKMIN